MTISMRNGLVQAGDDEQIRLELVTFQMYRQFNNIVGSVNSQFRINWDSEHSSANSDVQTTQVYSIPEGQYTASTLAYQLQSLLVYNPLTITAGQNDTFVVRDTAQGPARSVTVTLPAGNPSPTAICNAVMAQLNAAVVGNPYTCTYNSTQLFASGAYTISIASGLSWKFRIDFSSSVSAYRAMGVQQATYGGSTDASMTFTASSPFVSVLPPLVNGNPLGVSYNAVRNVLTFTPPANAYSAQLIFNDSDLNCPMAAELLGFNAGTYTPAFTTPYTSDTTINVNTFDNMLLTTNLAPANASPSIDNFSALPLQDGGSTGGSINPVAFQPSNVSSGFKASQLLAMLPVDAPANQLIFHQFDSNQYSIQLADSTIPYLRFQIYNEFGGLMPLDDCEWTATFRISFMRAKSTDNDQVVGSLETIKGLMKIAIQAFARR